MRQKYKKPSQIATAFKTDQIRLMRKGACYDVTVSSLRFVNCPMSESIMRVLTCSVGVHRYIRQHSILQALQPLPHHIMNITPSKVVHYQKALFSRDLPFWPRGHQMLYVESCANEEINFHKNMGGVPNEIDLIAL